MTSKFELPPTKTLISAAASMAATAMLIRSVTRDVIPDQLRHFLLIKFQQCLAAFSNEATLVMEEYDGLIENQLFRAAELYIGTIINQSTKRFRASLPGNESKILVSVAEHEEIADEFCGFRVNWRMIKSETAQRYVPRQDDFRFTTPSVTELKYVKLTFHKKHKKKVFDEYLPYIVERSKAVKEEKKTLKLYTLVDNVMCRTKMNPWQSVNLDHPANFETLAMDDDLKNMITDDLNRFVKRKEFYRKVGKAWKRGYLFYGPPGTGKSSLIAAMANHLNFDVYDLELTNITSNSELRSLLISTANRSILVVEDIDASLDLSERGYGAVPVAPMYPYRNDQQSKVTLSGLLNFIDGLWSSCGDERIIIFTTNHIKKLDPALLRPGRMDVHIHMSYCSPYGLRMLVRNYLDITEHPLVLEAEELIASTKVTPAEVGEQLLKSNDPLLALQGLIKFLEHKKEESDRNEKVGEIENGLIGYFGKEFGAQDSKDSGVDLASSLVALPRI